MQQQYKLDQTRIFDKLIFCALKICFTLVTLKSTPRYGSTLKPTQFYYFFCQIYINVCDID